MDFYVLKFPYRRILEPLAKRLSWLNPDHVSYAATFVAAGTGLCLIYAQKYPVLLLLGIVTIFARMTFNTIDGVMAIQRGKKTLVGEVVNALPDRYSDIFLMLGFVFSPLCEQVLAILALVTVFTVSYTGMLGKAVGVSWQHQGPLGKVERLIIVMVFMLLQYFFQTLTLFGISYSYLSWCLVVFIVLGQFAVLNRLKGQLREICLLEWPQSAEKKFAAGKAVVVYDSATGNTQAIAEKVAEALGCRAEHIKTSPSLKDTSLVVFCSPNIRSQCTPRLAEYLKKNARDVRDYALVITYGAPLLGCLTSILAFRKMKQQLGGRCLGVFVAKGFHAKFKTFRGRPNDKDKEGAVLFGINLAKKFARRSDG